MLLFHTLRFRPDDDSGGSGDGGGGSSQGGDGESGDDSQGGSGSGSGDDRGGDDDDADDDDDPAGQGGDDDPQERRLTRENQSLRKRLREAEQAKADLEAKDLSEKERAEKERNEAVARADKAEARTRSLELRTNTERAAGQLKVRFHDVDDAVVFVEREVDMGSDDPPTLEDVKSVVKNLIKTKPHLFAESSSGGGGDPTSGTRGNRSDDLDGIKDLRTRAGARLSRAYSSKK